MAVEYSLAFLSQPLWADMAGTVREFTRVELQKPAYIKAFKQNNTQKTHFFVISLITIYLS